ncbi:hypothetical protein [Dyella acidiphila]|uniref:Uncharacterized protein n=1 Tax=Dyella acidiphila TaxID=2775866 RepID=A0ABR9G638_9GAMM|nr:hypothetical protein [Dyella acidiphila]MBE1159502.1 hypothetical protein [Dyella acidiphila]
MKQVRSACFIEAQASVAGWGEQEKVQEAFFAASNTNSGWETDKSWSLE